MNQKIIANQFHIFLASAAFVGIQLVCSQCPPVEDYPVVVGKNNILCGKFFQRRGSEDIKKVFSQYIVLLKNGNYYHIKTHIFCTFCLSLPLRLAISMVFAKDQMSQEVVVLSYLTERRSVCQLYCPCFHLALYRLDFQPFLIYAYDQCLFL